MPLNAHVRARFEQLAEQAKRIQMRGREGTLRPLARPLMRDVGRLAERVRE
jgi:hypothetical protein